MARAKLKYKQWRNHLDAITRLTKYYGYLEGLKDRAHWFKLHKRRKKLNA